MTIYTYDYFYFKKRYNQRKARYNYYKDFAFISNFDLYFIFKISMQQSPMTEKVLNIIFMNVTLKV